MDTNQSVYSLSFVASVPEAPEEEFWKTEKIEIVSKASLPGLHFELILLLDDICLKSI